MSKLDEYREAVPHHHRQHSLIYPWIANGAEAGDRQYEGRPCQSPTIPITAGPAPPLSGQITALRHTFNILHAGASVTGRFRHPTPLPPYRIRQHGPSFSIGARVESPEGVTNYRLGIIQEIVQSQRQAHYINLTTENPWMVAEWTSGTGLDLMPRSSTPWYDSTRTVEMNPTATTGAVDEPGNDLRLIVDAQGNLETGGPPIEGKLARLSGCSRFRTWLVVEDPIRGNRAAIAWVAWVANFDIQYRTVFTSLTSPVSTTATSSASTGWVTSPLVLGAGSEPIPQHVAPAHTRRWKAA